MQNLIRFPVLALLSLGIIVMHSMSGMAAEKLNLGMIGSSPKKMIDRFSPLLSYLSSKGVPTGKVVTTKNTDQMIKKFKQGKVHFMFDSAANAIRLMETVGASPILIREKKGVRQYNSVIFVKKDSSIYDIADLKGKVVAFEDPESTSSYFLPRHIIAGSGLELQKSRKPIPGKVAYYFSKADDNTIAQVKSGKRAQAGGIKVGEVAEMKEFRLLKPQSPFVPRHVVIVAKDLDYSNLKRVLLAMKNDPAAKTALKKSRTPTGFSEFSGNPEAELEKVKLLLGN